MKIPKYHKLVKEQVATIWGMDTFCDTFETTEEVLERFKNSIEFEKLKELKLEHPDSNIVLTSEFSSFEGENDILYVEVQWLRPFTDSELISAKRKEKEEREKKKKQKLEEEQAERELYESLKKKFES